MKPSFVDHCSSEHNFIPLSPISFLERSARVHGDKTSIVFGSSLRFSWKETHRRCLNLAASLVRLGISRHDVVVAFAPNVPALYELHFGVPMSGGVLCALNFRLDDTTLAVVLYQLEPKLIIVDYQFLNVVVKALYLLEAKTRTTEQGQDSSFKIPTLVLIPETNNKTLDHTLINYNDLVNDRDEEFKNINGPIDERDPISVNYTSGSTGKPKGVVYSHRAVYLNSTAVIVNSNMRHSSVFLWTVDMFRCNGWCYPWATAALGATNVCLRTIENNLSATIILDAIACHGVTHLCGKPGILTTLAALKSTPPMPSRVDIIVAGVLPSPEILARVTEMGFNVSHGYGMTEALGPAIIEPWRGGYNYSNSLMTVEGFDVKDPVTMESVASNGKTSGEIMFRGNTLMSGYLGNRKLTARVFKDGWYRTGDVGIRHMDGSVQVVDRAEDVVVVRGGRVVSTLEVEAVLLRHSKVSEAAVVGRYDHDDHENGDHDGDDQYQVPVAFVKLKEGCESGCCSKEIADFCEGKLPGYMVPSAVIFGDLPVNSTGKVQKFVLRYKANNATNGNY